MNSRNEFEAWFSDQGLSPEAVERSADGSYKLMQAHSAWQAWQASRSAIGDRLKEVATVERWNQGGSGEFTTATGIEKLPHGTKLYTLEQTND